MKLRNKFLISLSGLVLLMAAVFFALSEGYTRGLFENYANMVESRSATQLAQLLREYYVFHSDSWNGVEDFMTGLVSRDESLTLVDSKTNQIVFRYPPNVQPDSYGKSYPVNIQVSGTTVGTLYIRDRSTQGLYAMEQTVLHSMTKATVWGMLATAAGALILGAWLAGRITKPLSTMTTAMKQIEDGDLETRLPTDYKDEFGQVASAFNAMIDRLYQTEQSRRHLVADVAHELRTPLTIMQGKLELIQQGVEPAEPEQLLPIQDEIVRLTRLVQDLHQLSLAEVGQLPLKKQFTDMNELLERMVDNFSIEAEDHDVQLHFQETSEKHIIANVDPNRITQVFVNLVGNALRYTPPGGSITVELKQEDNYFHVGVSDTGSGIDEKHLEHIFDRFYRAQEDRSRGSGGTGLGLAIAKEFVEAHSGRIAVSSSVGVGTTFTVTLPL